MVDLLPARHDESTMSVDDEDCLNTSLMSVDDEDSWADWERRMLKKSKRELIDSLKAALEEKEELSAKLKKFEPLHDFFKCETVRGTSFTYTMPFDTFGLRLLSQGVSGADLHRVCEGLVELCPALVESEDGRRSCPKKDYFNNLRKVIPRVNSAQIEDFVAQSTELTLTVDGSPVGNRYSVLGMSLINHLGHSVAIALREASGKKADDIVKDMRASIDDTGLTKVIVSKLKVLMSDRDRTQACANKKFKEQLFTEFGVTIAILPCTMHLTSNLENFFAGQKSALENAVKAAHHDLKLIFGSRITHGFRRDSLKRELNRALGQRDDASLLLTDCGSR